MGERRSKRVARQRFVGPCWQPPSAPASFLNGFPVHSEPKQGGVMADTAPLPETSAASGKLGEALGKRLHADDGG